MHSQRNDTLRVRLVVNFKTLKLVEARAKLARTWLSKKTNKQKQHIIFTCSCGLKCIKGLFSSFLVLRFCSFYLANKSMLLVTQSRTPSKLSSFFSGTQEKCRACTKTVYPLEKVSFFFPPLSNHSPFYQSLYVILHSLFALLPFALILYT